LVFFDNQSTDNSVAIINSFPNTEVIVWDSGGQVRDDLYLQIKNNCWKKSRGKADFVIVGDADEFLFHSDILNRFRTAMVEGFTLLKPEGYHMIGDFELKLTPSDNLLKLVTSGIRGESNDKLMAFNPNAISEINYLPGCHSAKPIGNVRVCRDSNLKMLHFKYLGFEDFLSKQLIRGSRLSEFNRVNGLGLYYLYSPEKHKSEYLEFLERRRPIFTAEDIGMLNQEA
jgi:hypothetical protein